METFLGLIIVVSAVWVYFDAKSLGARPGRLNGGLFDMGPAGWAFSVLILWVVAFPAYLWKRRVYKDTEEPISLVAPPSASGLADAITQIERLAALKDRASSQTTSSSRRNAIF